jgi:Protein of unknown function (DUF1566)
MTTVFTLVLMALAAGSARFEATDGAVRDNTTSLLWSQKDNGADVDFAGAKKFCDDLTLAGHDDWRLPTIEELRRLYDEKVSAPPTYLYRGKPYPLRMDPAFQLTAPGIWSSSLRYENRGVAWSFFFSSGRELSTLPTATNYQRALCVRGG